MNVESVVHFGFNVQPRVLVDEEAFRFEGGELVWLGM
jgi:hypothetical protein